MIAYAVPGGYDAVLPTLSKNGTENSAFPTEQTQTLRGTQLRDDANLVRYIPDEGVPESADEPTAARPVALAGVIGRIMG